MPGGRITPGGPGADSELESRGTIEVTARLVEIPEKAIFERELYNYATVLKYEVTQVHRGKVKGQTIYVAHYNPFKPRSRRPIGACRTSAALSSRSAPARSTAWPWKNPCSILP